MGSRVFQGVGISAFTQADLFFFSLVIAEKQNKTSCEPFGTSGKVPLLRIAESENCGERSWKPLLRSPFFPGCVWVTRGSPGCVREQGLSRGSQQNRPHHTASVLSGGTRKGRLHHRRNKILLLTSNYKKEKKVTKKRKKQKEVYNVFI